MLKAAPSPVKAYDHQLQSLSHNDRTPIVFDCSDPGTGKTFVRIMAMAKRIKKGQVRKVLVLAPLTLLETVWAADIKKFAPHLRVSVSTSGKHDKAFKEDADVYVTNIDAVKWLAKQPKSFFAAFDELVVDECFPAGTPVDTPTGPRFIEAIEIGDLVCTSAGALPVTNTFVSQSNLLVRLELDDGTTFECTENHPVATSEGWRNAGAVSGMQLVRLDVPQYAQSRATVLLPQLQQISDVESQHATGASGAYQEGRSSVERSPVLESGRALPTGNQDALERRASSDETSAQSTRRERQNCSLRSHGRGNVAEDLGTAVCDPDEEISRFGLPDQLQSGLCQPPATQGFGDRRQFAHIAQILGCEERRIASLSRVVSVTRLEQSSPRSVFNLQVDGPHDYSVKGTLVHNCTAFKHHTSQRSKAASKISGYFKYKACLTGTPNSNSITDVWHQVKILDGGKRLGPTFFGFRNAVCVAEQVGRHQHAIRWHDKEGAEEVVFGLLSDIVIRHKLEDCTDIPANHQYTVPYIMPSKQRHAYEQMAQGAITEIFGSPVERATAVLKKQKLVPKAHITAINAAAVATKLLQIASGAVYENAGADTYHVIDTERYEFIMDLVEQRKHSVVFFMWRHQRDLMAAEADRRGLTFAVIDGNTSQNERRDIVKRYQAGQYRTVFLHPQSAAHGLTLTRGTAAIWASPTANAEFFNQGSRRVYRISQTKKTETITVLAKDSYEERVYHEILAPKNGRMANLLDLFSTL